MANIVYKGKQVIGFPDELSDFSCLYFAIDADQSSKTYNSGTNISQINDLSGNAFHATSTTFPEYVANAYGTKGAIRFGTSDFLNITIPVPPSFSLYFECTKSALANSYLIGSSGSAGTPTILSGFAGDFEYFISGSLPRTVIAATGSTSGLQKFLVTHRTNSRVTTWLNGSLVANLVSSIANPPIGNFLYIGSSDGDRNYAQFDLRRLVIFEGILNANDIPLLFGLD